MGKRKSTRHRHFASDCVSYVDTHIQTWIWYPVFVLFYGFKVYMYLDICIQQVDMVQKLPISRRRIRYPVAVDISKKKTVLLIMYWQLQEKINFYDACQLPKSTESGCSQRAINEYEVVMTHFRFKKLCCKLPRKTACPMWIHISRRGYGILYLFCFMVSRCTCIWIYVSSRWIWYLIGVDTPTTRFATRCISANKRETMDGKNVRLLAIDTSRQTANPMWIHISRRGYGILSLFCFMVSRCTCTWIYVSIRWIWYKSYLYPGEGYGILSLWISQKNDCVTRHILAIRRENKFL
jgi:hypothetical protein